MSGLGDLAGSCTQLFGTYAAVGYEAGDVARIPTISIAPKNHAAARITIIEAATGYTVFAESLEVDSESSASLSHDEFALGVISMVARYGVREYPWLRLGVLSVCGPLENIEQAVGKRRLAKETARWEPWTLTQDSIPSLLGDVEAQHPVLRSVQIGVSPKAP